MNPQIKYGDRKTIEFVKNLLNLFEITSIEAYQHNCHTFADYIPSSGNSTRRCNAAPTYKQEFLPYKLQADCLC